MRKIKLSTIVMEECTITVNFSYLSDFRVVQFICLLRLFLIYFNVI